VKDFADVTRPFDPGADFLEIRLQTRDTGKVNNGMNCAVCHTTQLKVGDFSHFSKERGVFSEKSVFFRKGTNYPIYLSEIVQNLSAATQNTGTPTTTATNSANILAATNQPRAFVVNDPQSKLGTNKPWSNFPTDPSVAIGTLTVPKIDVTWEAAVGNTALDTNGNAGGGVRMFPDALTPSASGFRNTVIVNVKTTPPLPNQVVRLKSFDVDDPSTNAGGILDTNDYFGFPAGNDNIGTPKTGQLSQTTLTLDSQGKAFSVLTVPTQPGDNLRVAAVLDTPGAQAYLDSLQVTVASDDFYVSADTNAVPDFVGGISPMLTIWRKLHLEFDTMIAPPTSGAEANYVTAAVNWFRPNYPTTGRSLIGVRHPQVSSGKGLFENGKIEITGVGTFAVTGSSTFSDVNNRAFTALALTNSPSGVQTNQTVKLYDDDDQYLTNEVVFQSILDLPSPPLPALHHLTPFINTNQVKFGEAYIMLVNANALGWNTQTNIAFARHADIGTTTSLLDVGNQQLKGTDKPEFWAFTVVFAYQGLDKEDGEDDSEAPLAGATREPLGGLLHSFSAVYLEAIRERQFALLPAAYFTTTNNKGVLRSAYFEDLYVTMAHEIGHAPGNQLEGTDHKEGAVMVKGAIGVNRSGFNAKTLRRFRTATSWTR
jgi:hypothetical protein